MATEFRMPALGENVQAGDVVGILVSVGDTVKPDQPVLEIETDKATIEVPISVGGTVKEVLVSEGEKVEVGQVILTVEEPGPASSDARPLPAAEVQDMVSDAAPEADTAGTEANRPEVKEAEAVAPAEESAPAAQKIEVKLPELGENVEAGDVVRVLVSAGDTVAPDQPMIELETDKATVEVPVPASGTVTEVHVREGDKVRVGQVILTLTGVPAASERSAPARPSRPAEPEAPPRQEAPETPLQAEGTAKQGVTTPMPIEEFIPPAGPDIEPEPARSSVPAAPNVRRLAREIGVDITQVQGSGPGSRVTMDDVKRHAREYGPGGAISFDGRGITLPDFSKWGEIERQAMSNIRRTTAERLSQAWLTVPHVTQFDQADIVELEELRKRFSGRVEAAGGKLTITAILLKIVAAALKEFPQVNASVDMGRKEIIYKKYYHIGVAVDTDRGLLVPVIRDVDKKNIIELALELGEAAEKARNRKLALEDMQGGAFTITNLGGIGGTYFTPIVNAPEVAILGVARGRIEPVYRNGQFEPRLMLPLALSYDHRLVDGADGIRFLRRIVEHLEQPFLTSLQGW